MKRGIVKCLYDRAKHLTSKPSAISKEKEHLSSVLVSNGYPSSFVRKLTKTTRPTANKEPTQEFKSTAVLPYIKGVSVCGKVYIGETGRAMQDRIKQHDRDIRLARTQTSAVSEHANETGHFPIWKEVKFIDHDPHWYTRRVKEAIHIRLHPNSRNSRSLKFQKLGYLRSESITADQPQSGPVRKQHLIVGIIMRIEMHQ